MLKGENMSLNEWLAVIAVSLLIFNCTVRWPGAMTAVLLGLCAAFLWIMMRDETNTITNDGADSGQTPRQTGQRANKRLSRSRARGQLGPVETLALFV
jgi:hypothetical protein